MAIRYSKSRSFRRAFTFINGRGVSINQGATVLAMLAGGVLYSVDPILPFLAGTGLHALGLAVLLTLPKNPQYANSGTDQASQKPFTISKALPLIRRKLTSSSLRSTVVYLALFIAAIRATQDYVQPINTTTLGLPVASIGVLYAGFTTTAAIAGYHAETLKGKFGIQEVVTGVPLMLGLFLLGSIFVPLLSLVAFFMLQTSEAALRPIVGQYLNDQIASVGRATVLSSISMVNGIVQLPLYGLTGVIADRYTPLIAIAAIGGMLLVGWIVIQSIEPPVSHPEGQTSTSQKSA